ncbi:MAG: hypothetical protein RIR49_185 [Actinomycetota bacterium]|jgi:hypothetical protein
MALAASLALAACGGGDDIVAEETSTTTAAEEPAATTTIATTTVAPTTTVPLIVTEGAVVVVANANSVNGSAGRMTEILQGQGFSLVTPTNSTEGPLGASKVYYVGGDDAALAVAESLVRVFGGAIQLLELPTVAPIQSSDMAGASVLVALGDDFADRIPAGLPTTTVATTTGG